MNLYLQVNDCRKKETKNEKLICKKNSLIKTKYQWLKLLSYGPNKTKIELVNIWLSIFAINARSFLNPHWVIDQVKSIEKEQFTNYENLLYSQLTNPGLLSYLNAFRNKKNNPNENLARELLELYTVGEGNFTEEDVKNTSLALTGILLDNNEKIKFSEKFHFQGYTSILGKTDKFNLKKLTKWLAKQPSTAENIAKRFINYLLGEEVKSNEIANIIKEFKKSNLDLRSLYSSISKSEKYLACQKYGTRLLDPYSLASRTIALIGSPHENNYKISAKFLKQMGQSLLEPPNPKGWPFGERWITSSRISNRKKGLINLLADEEIWDTRNTPKILRDDLVSFEPFNIDLPTEPSRENIGRLITDPSWNFSGPIDLNLYL